MDEKTETWLLGEWVSSHEGVSDFLFITENYASISSGLMKYDDYEYIKHKEGRLRYSIKNDTLTLRTYRYSNLFGWVDNYKNIQIDSKAQVLFISDFAGNPIQTYKKVTPDEIEAWREERTGNMSREFASLEVEWPDDFHWDDGYGSYAYGLENGFWRYSMEDGITVFNFKKGFGEDAGMNVIRLDTEGNQLSKILGKWELSDVNEEIVIITLENGDVIKLEYDRENYGMLYDKEPLTYLIQAENDQVYPNKDIDKDNAFQFFNQFYDKFLNLRSDGSFTIDILTEENGIISGVKHDFLDLLTEKWKKNYDNFPTSQDRDPIYELSYAGLYSAKDILLSKTPKDIRYLGNLGKYNFKVAMDYQDGVHSVLFRLVEEDDTLLIDEATAAY